MRKAVLFDLENTIIPPGGPFDDDGRGDHRARRERPGSRSASCRTRRRDGWRPRSTPKGSRASRRRASPRATAFLEACAELGVAPAEAVYVGDQVITDVLGSQRAGLRAVLVKPKYTKEFRSAKFQRLVARVVIRLAGKRRRWNEGRSDACD